MVCFVVSYRFRLKLCLHGGSSFSFLLSFKLQKKKKFHFAVVTNWRSDPLASEVLFIFLFSHKLNNGVWWLEKSKHSVKRQVISETENKNISGLILLLLLVGCSH